MEKCTERCSRLKTVPFLHLAAVYRLRDTEDNYGYCYVVPVIHVIFVIVLYCTLRSNGFGAKGGDHVN